MSEEKKREREETLPKSLESYVLNVRPESVRQYLLEEFFTTPLGVELGASEISDLIKSYSEKLHEKILHGNKRIPQSLMMTHSKKSLLSSLKLVFIANYTDILIELNAITSKISEILERLKDPTLSPDTRGKYLGELQELIIQLLSMPRSVVRLVKDIESLMNINLPFHLKSDLARNLLGYTSTSS